MRGIVEVNDISKRPGARRWLRIGPATIIALAIAALLGARWLKTETARRQQSNLPPVIERRVISSSVDEKRGPTPEVSFIIERANKLSLNARQFSRLQGLQSEWKKYHDAKIAEAKGAMENVDEYMDRAKGKQRVPVAQIEREAAPVIAISGEISAVRQRYWSQALNVLTPAQTKQIQKEREEAWSAKRGRTTPPTQ